MRRALYGGSFNPIHNDHLRLCERFHEEFSLDKIILIPTFSTPLKDNSAIIEGDERLLMCRLACQGTPFIEVSDIEVRRQGISYTSDTVRALKKTEDELFLIVGADMFVTLDQWHDCSYLFENATILAAVRNDLDINILNEKYKRLQALGCKALFSKEPIGGLSSTLIREKLKRGEDVSDCLPPSVYAYIKEHELYT